MLEHTHLYERFTNCAPGTGLADLAAFPYVGAGRHLLQLHFKPLHTSITSSRPVRRRPTLAFGLLLLLRPALASQRALLAFSGHRPWHPRAEEEEQTWVARVF